MQNIFCVRREIQCTRFPAATVPLNNLRLSVVLY